MDSAGKVCVITGASSGIGRRTALDLAADGARVCAAARREDRLQELVDEMGGAERGHSYRVTDVSQRDEVRSLAKFVADTYGRCDVLINNAGFGSERLFDAPDAIDEVQRVVQTNFFGAVYCTGELLPLLIASAPSHVVNVASVAGRLAFPGGGAYCGSKFAMVGWAESIHYDLAPYGVSVGLIEPGLIPTEGFSQEDVARDPVLRYALGSVEGVSAAIRDAIASGKVQRVTPRWYYLLQFPRLIVPPFYRFAVKRLIEPKQARRREHS